MLLNFAKALYNAAGDAPPTVPPPATESADDAAKKTKAYSDLHNEFKSFKSSAEKTANELKQKLAKYESAGKTPEQLQEEATQERTKREAAEARLTQYDANMKSMIDASMNGLTDDQKKMVTEYASDDNFKRLNFIGQLKGQKPAPLKTSQGAPPNDGGPIDIDVKAILEECNNGNVTLLRAAKKKFGEKAVNDAIAKATPKQSIMEKPTVPSVG